MVFLRRSLVLVLGILLIVFVAACGGTPTTATNSSSAHTASTMTTQTSNTPNSNQANSNTNSQENSQMTATPTTQTLIRTKQVNVNGHMEMVLTTSKGMTLYERTSDPKPGSSCTGPCAHVWPPLLSHGTVIGTASIGGKLTVHLTANGKQVEYNGHPLYTYSGDMAPGETNGQGVGNVWQVVTTAFQQQHW